VRLGGLIHRLGRGGAIFCAVGVVVFALASCTLQLPPPADGTSSAPSEDSADSVSVAIQPGHETSVQVEVALNSTAQIATPELAIAPETPVSLPSDLSYVVNLLDGLRDMIYSLVDLTTSDLPAPPVQEYAAPPTRDTINIAFASPSGRIGATSSRTNSGGRSFTTQDADGDGVPDSLDLCRNTPAHAIVSAAGCPTDEDGDGVYDGIDQCPGTPNFVRMVVDSAGCPADADGDGVPDYLDYCPGTPRGYEVTKLGCLPDGDGDGVADVDDHCPDTPKGMAVDESGCLLITQLHRQLALQINYIPGTTELDRLSQRILDDLAIRMAEAPAIIAVVEGFTEAHPNNLTSLVASQDNVERVIRYLATRGVNEGRIRASAVPDLEQAESQTATVADLPDNYRIEISFYSADE